MAITKDMTMRNRITLADVMRQANACSRCKGRKKIDSMVGTKENCPECWGTGVKQKEVEGVLEPKKPNYPGMDIVPSVIEINVLEMVENENFKNAIDVTPEEYGFSKRKAGRPKKVKE